MAAAGGLDVVGELDADRHGEIEVAQVSGRPRPAPSRIGSRNTSAVSGKNELPIQPSASSPVRRRLAGPE